MANQPAGKEPGLAAAMYYMDIATLLKCPLDRDPRNADVALVGIPYSGGNARERGQYLGPRAVRNVSSGCYRVNRANKIEPFELCRINDLGDVPLPNVLDPNQSVKDIQTFYERVYGASAIPLTVGGDHSITLPILRALQRSPRFQGPVAMIHIDSHMDAWGPEWGTDVHCGAGFKLAVEEGIIDPRRTIQIGIRGSMWDRDQEQYAYDVGFRVVTAAEFDEIGVAAVLAEARRVVGNAPTYISLDLDALDPIYAPGVSAPEAYGIGMKEMGKLLQGFRGLEVVGADVVCLVPDRDPVGITALNALVLLFELVCITADSIHSRRGER